MEDYIRTFKLENSYIDEDNPWKDIVKSNVFAIYAKFHTANKLSLGQLYFGR